MRIDLNKFFGEAPSFSPVSLPDGFAQLALNCDLSGGTLAPMRGPRDVMALGVPGVRTIYKYGYQNASETQWWFAFNQHVHIAKTQVFDDVEERTYWTGPWPTGASRLRKTRFDLATTGPGPYPAAWLDGSIPAPGSAPLVFASGGSTTVEPERRAYTATFVTTWDEESENGPVSARISVNVGGSVELTGLPVPPAGAHAINRKRIWRTVYVGGEAGDVRLVAEIPAGQLTYTDNIPNEDLPVNSIATNGWDAAPEGLDGLIGLPNQMAAAHKGFDVYFCAPQAYYAWPTEYVQPLDEAVVALGVNGQSVIALTKNKTYAGYGLDPESINLVKAEIPSQCGGTVSARSVISEAGGVSYVNRNGLISLSGSGASVVTEKYFGREEWGALAPHTMLSAMSGNTYLAFYDNGSPGGIVLSPDAPGVIRTNIHATAAHKFDGRLYLAVNDRLVCWDEGDPLQYTWRSRKHILPSPANMAVGKVIASNYPVTIRLYADGVLRGTKNVTSRNEFALPSGYLAEEFEIQIEGTSRVERVVVAETSAELADVAV